MVRNKRIPIRAAKEVSEKYDFPEVVIFAYDPETHKQHVTTYGKTKDQCIDSANAGNYLKKALGWPDKLCHAEPMKAKKNGAEFDDPRDQKCTRPNTDCHARDVTGNCNNVTVCKITDPREAAGIDPEEAGVKE